MSNSNGIIKKKKKKWWKIVRIRLSYPVRMHLTCSDEFSLLKINHAKSVFFGVINFCGN